MIEKGPFIVVYGANNLGKTTLATSVATWLNEKKVPVVHFKFPIYDLPPTGPRINAYLRQGNPEGFTMEAVQNVYARNRGDFLPIMTNIRRWGIGIIAEDYKHTSIAWGVTGGVPLQRMIDINHNVPDPEFAILLDGERFTNGIEVGHAHESGSMSWDKNRRIHLELAQTNNWPIVAANQTQEKVLSDTKEIVSEYLVTRYGIKL